MQHMTNGKRVDDEQWEEKIIHLLKLVISHNQSAHEQKHNQGWHHASGDETLGRVMITLLLFDEGSVRVNVQSVGSKWKEGPLEWQ